MLILREEQSQNLAIVFAIKLQQRCVCVYGEDRVRVCRTTIPLLVEVEVPVGALPAGVDDEHAAVVAGGDDVVGVAQHLLLADVRLEVGVRRPDGRAVHVLGRPVLGQRALQVGDLLGEHVLVRRLRVAVEADGVLEVVVLAAVRRVAVVGVEAQLSVRLVQAVRLGARVDADVQRRALGDDDRDARRREPVAVQHRTERVDAVDDADDERPSRDVHLLHGPALRVQERAAVPAERLQVEAVVRRRLAVRQRRPCQVEAVRLLTVGVVVDDDLQVAEPREAHRRLVEAARLRAVGRQLPRRDVLADVADEQVLALAVDRLQLARVPVETDLDAVADLECDPARDAVVHGQADDDDDDEEERDDCQLEAELGGQSVFTSLVGPRLLKRVTDVMSS